jgi:hypothetical protein
MGCMFGEGKNNYRYRKFLSHSYLRESYRRELILRSPTIYQNGTAAVGKDHDLPALVIAMAVVFRLHDVPIRVAVAQHRALPVLKMTSSK